MEHKPPPSPMRRRLYGLEISMFLAASGVGFVIGLAAWPILGFASLFEGGVIPSLIVWGAAALVVAIVIDVIIAKSGKRQTRGLLFPATSIVLGLLAGFGIVGACAVFLFRLFGTLFGWT